MNFADRCTNELELRICTNCNNIQHKVYKPFEKYQRLLSTFANVCLFFIINAFINVYYYFWTFNASINATHKTNIFYRIVSSSVSTLPQSIFHEISNSKLLVIRNVAGFSGGAEVGNGASDIRTSGHYSEQHRVAAAHGDAMSVHASRSPTQPTFSSEHTA